MWVFDRRAVVTVMVCAIVAAAVPLCAQTAPAGNATAASKLVVNDPANLLLSGTLTTVQRPVYDFAGDAADLNRDGRPERVTLYISDGTFVQNQAGTDWEVQIQQAAGVGVGPVTVHSTGGNHVAAHLNNRACGAREGSVFTIQEVQISDTPIDEFSDPFRFELERLRGTFVLNCVTNVGDEGQISGEFLFEKIGSGGSSTPTPPGDEPPAPPPPPPFQISLPSELTVAPLVLSNSGQQALKIQTLIDSTFDSDLHLSVFANALEQEDFHVEVSPSVIAAPGAGDAEITIHTGPLTRPRRYMVTVFATAAGVTQGTSFVVEVVCTPPFILGVDQPVPSLNGPRTQVSLQAKPSGTGPYSYQWFRGFPGMTRDPLATAPTLVVPNETGTYWVRISNACGSTDSVAAQVFAP
jgi:hypothetical protein